MMKNAFDHQNPLETLVPNGGFCGIFHTIGCIGDSLSSGEFESTDESGVRRYHDMYEYSWGQCIARHTGCRVYNFSKGGLTAKQYIESFGASCGGWDEDKKCQTYIIALGVNDILNYGMEVGSVQDIDRDHPENNAPTFAGYYAQIIQRIKVMQPRARFFLMSIFSGGNWVDEGDQKKKAHRDLLQDLCNYFDNTYLIDMFTYGPHVDAAFREKYFFGGHMSPAGYLYVGQLVETYIDYIVRNNPDDFKDVCFIGTDLKR